MVALTGLITAIWAIVKFGIKRKDQQLEKSNEFMESLSKRLQSIEENNAQQSARIDENERGRLRHEIMSFSRELRSGYADMNAHDYEHICQVYDRYKELGGNSYARAEFDFIMECKREFDRQTQHPHEGE